MMQDVLRIMTCGSVDDGKSTLIGHLLYDAKLIFTDQEKALELESRLAGAGGGPDYSIGLFQMKPSFVEAMEKAWMRSGLARQYELWFDTDDTVTARRIRISRLQKEEWQVIYVGVFLRLLYATYGSVNKRGEHTQDGLETLPVADQLRLAATAYNRGVVWAAPGYGDLSALREHATEKHFHYALIPTRFTRRYCYAALALKHYKKIAR